ncbi:MAG TPA: AMP-binding protein [Dissulfurispiraceae bacterium]|nr:AMP-binding protein [Dissulfurispiraceae bacterium]
MLDQFLSQTEFGSYEEFIEQFEINVPEQFNFAYDVVDVIAARESDRRALVWCNDSGADAVFTFSQLRDFSNRAANVLSGLGIHKGDPVMLILKRRYEFWFVLLALHRIGAIAIPATHLLSERDIAYRNNAADVKMIISVAEDSIVSHVDASHAASPSLELKALVGGTRDGWIDFNAEAAKASDRFEQPFGDTAALNSDPMLLYFTSGTTGMPKMVLHTFTYPLGHILTARYWQNVQDGGLHLTVADTGWAKAMWGNIYGQWIAGCAVFIYDYDKFNPGRLLDAIEKYGVTSFCAPPTIYRVLVKETLSRYRIDRLQYCVVAGEPLNPEAFNRFLEQTGIRLMEGYGQTELTVAIATWPWMEPKPGSMGKPSPWYDVDLLDDEGKSCEPGEEGQIVIRTDRRRPVGMFAGYYREHERTVLVWHDGIYYTGDMAWRDKDGYYWFVGRADDLIKSAGYRIGPFEVESALLEHPAVFECAVTGVPDATRGQAVKASVVLTGGYTAGDALAKELQDYVRKVTAPYKYPRFIEFVEEIPKTISGKIRRVEIREQDIQ